MSKQKGTTTTLPIDLQPYSKNHLVSKVIRNAKLGRYHDFSSTSFDLPKMTLMDHLQQVINASKDETEIKALKEIYKRVSEGDYDDDFN